MIKNCVKNDIETVQSDHSFKVKEIEKVHMYAVNTSN